MVRRVKPGLVRDPHTRVSSADRAAGQIAHGPEVAPIGLEDPSGTLLLDESDHHGWSRPGSERMMDSLRTAVDSLGPAGGRARHPVRAQIRTLSAVL